MTRTVRLNGSIYIDFSISLTQCEYYYKSKVLSFEYIALNMYEDVLILNGIPATSSQQHSLIKYSASSYQDVLLKANFTSHQAVRDIRVN